MSSVLEIYQRLLHLSQQMPPLARQEQWDALAALQAERSQLFEHLPSRKTIQNSTQQALVQRTLLEIQACDEQVREYLLPCHELIGKLIAGSRKLDALTP